MSTYKVIQDIEAEDKLLGPLTLRQFIYALVSVFFLYLCFIVITKHAPFLLAVFFPPAAFTGFFAFPFVKDQPTEVWALAKLRFLFKPRKRIWDQSGVKELVTVTVPKKIERVLTDGLSQNEVTSRLGALASTLDSRGWAIKNVNVNLYAQPAFAGMMGASSDRLIDMSSIPQPVPTYDVQASDDILDERNNVVAQQFDQMINASAQAHRQQMIDQMNSTLNPATAQAPAVAQASQPADYWFMNQPQAAASQPMFSDSALQASIPVAQPETEEDEALVARIKATRQAQQATSHLRTLQPIDDQAPVLPTTAASDYSNTNNAEQALAPSPDGSQAAILSLANNNDLSVATIARQANKATDGGTSDGEVVVSLR
jgi:hypothetical protein